MENMKVTRKEWLLDKKTRDDALDDLTKKVDKLTEKIDPIVDIYKDARFLVKLVKWIVIGATSILVLWGLIKSNILK
jgi:hypothetical protein